MIPYDFNFFNYLFCLLAKPQVVDHDEDRRNPQYIPKKGTFYEHDDRTAAG